MDPKWGGEPDIVLVEEIAQDWNGNIDSNAK